MSDKPLATNAAPPPWRSMDYNLAKHFPLNWENLLVLVILFLAVVTRLYGLGDRAVSHDEVNHFVPSYDFSQGIKYIFDPMTHGPLQMHLITLSFVLLGDNDFTARLPAALFSIATVGIALFLFRRYLGRVGALLAGLFFLISPYMLYYGRYQRNEVFIVVWSLLTMYAVLRYLERGEWGALILYTVVNALHFTDKATGFIYAGGQMIFLAVYVFVRALRRPQMQWITRIQVLVGLGVAALFVGFAAFMVRPELGKEAPDIVLMLPGIIVGVIGLAALVFALVILWQDAGQFIRRDRAFDLMVLLGTLVLPLTSAAWMISIGKFTGTTSPEQMYFSSLTTLADFLSSSQLGQALAYILPLAVIAIVIGVLWRPRQWPILAAIFYGIFVFFFTSIFTNPGGFFDGLVRFLGYWIVQHGESRGEQPWFYYLFVQIPIYEYLPLFGAVAAFFVALGRRIGSASPFRPHQPPDPESEESRPVPAIWLFLFWALFSLAIFSYAGEKMPQQTMLISAPMILSAAWLAAYLLERKPSAEEELNAWKLNVPQWGIEYTFNYRQFLRNVALFAFTVMALLTARTAYYATFINYDYPNEYMAYAHGAPGPKIALTEIERLSRLTTGGPDMVVAYDNFVRYPFWWYLRHYPNKIDFGENPTADIRRAAIVCVGEQNNSQVKSILGDDYVSFEQVRMWWHNEDYFTLKWSPSFIGGEYLREQQALGVESPPPMGAPDYLRLVWGHVGPIFLNPKARSAAFQIWLNRDFAPWGMVMQRGGYSYQDWSLMEHFTIYFRKDILDYLGGDLEGTGGSGGAYDPYELSRIDLIPYFILGQFGNGPGQFASPRGIAVAPDGSLYVADSMNHRIQHVDSNGGLISQWGTFGSLDQGNAPGGTFNEPWGVGLGLDGSVYVADTWNHRIQKFTADGEFLTMWGEPPVSAGEGAATFYGPRSVVVDSQGRVIVSDTGNKRIMVFTADGQLITQFGTPGAGEGQLDEPVGLALDELDRVYVADTWNRRVQIFAPNPDGSYTSVAMWDVNAWFGTTAEIKPYLAVDSNHHVYISDPSTCRILEFTERGVILAVWGRCGSDEFALNSPTGIAIDPLGGIWVSDSRNDRLVHYPMPSSGGGLPALR